MRKRWIILAIVLGLIAAEFVWLRFSGPLWDSAFRFECGVIGFSPDSREVLIVDGLFATVPNRPLPRLLRCDSRTGKILSAVDLPYPGPTDLMGLQISPDTRTLGVQVIGPVDPTDLKGEQPLVYCLHDTRTGSKLAGPIKLDYLGRFNFSPDGRFFWIHHHDAPHRFDVIESCTGKTILQLREHDDVEPYDLCFASDSSAVIVLWRRTPDAAESGFLQTFDLPNSTARQRFELPARAWQQVDKSVGKRIYLKAAGGAFPKHFMKTYSFELAKDSISEEREEPLLITYHGERGDEVNYSEEGPGWLAQISSGSYQKTRSDELLDWVAQKTGMKLDDKNGTCVRIRFLNPDTGQLRYELPRQLKYPFRISPDGRRVVSKYSDSAVEVWNTDPAPRWPWSLAAGSATVGVVLLFGRWRRRRELVSTTTA